MFVGPTEIAGMYSLIVEGLRSIGVRADLVERNPHPFAYPSAHRSKSLMLGICRRLNKACQSRTTMGKSRELTAMLRVLAILIWLSWTPIAMARYGTFFFVFGHSLWPFNLDLPILRLMGKKTLMHLGNGSEARPPYLGGNLHLDATSLKGAKKLRRQSKHAKRTVRMAEKYASIILGSPFSTHYFASKPFINSFHIGVPQLVLGPNSLGENQQAKSGFQILHAPSKPELKGTTEICAAIEELKAEGLNISLNFVSGVSNDVVREHISAADLIVDQLYSDTPMPVFATEASAQGKPTVIGSYAVEMFDGLIPQELKGTTIVCHPNNIKEAIRATVLSGSHLGQGELAREFVLKHLGPTEVAERIVRVLEGDTPPSWCVDPSGIMYLHGVGQSELASIRQVQGMIALLGPGSLQLDHKPKLRDALISWGQ
jgi:hypothetical protein